MDFVRHEHRRRANGPGPYLDDTGYQAALQALQTPAGSRERRALFADFDERARRAEIGIAKHAYVNARSGWFSDRSAHYLASGKPVLAQSTGVEGLVPCDRGFLTFDGDDEAVAGVEAINGNYEAHCRAAREFAAEYLDYRKVLPKMIESSLS